MICKELILIFTGKQTMKCQFDGTFGPHPPPVCQRISCKLPAVGDNCELIVNHPFVFESSIYYRPLIGLTKKMYLVPRLIFFGMR